MQRGDWIALGAVAGLGLFLFLTSTLSIGWPLWVYTMVIPVLAVAQGVAIGTGIRPAVVIGVAVALSGVALVSVAGRWLPLWIAAQGVASQWFFWTNTGADVIDRLQGSSRPSH